MTYKKKLIEVALPLDAINRESAREKSIRHGHPSTLHLWWARRPLAAARAVLWSSLVDDPSAHPDRFPTPEAQEVERQRLFRILEELVRWENSNDRDLLDAAHAEIVASCDGELPAILDPFCGGGTIPLEAQRLGLPAYGGDLNPVAVLISKAMVEIPPRFAALPPVNPESRENAGLRSWERAEGLAEDIRYYGQWVRDRAFDRIGHLYPKVALPSEQGGGEAPVVAWIWARTVESPDPSWKGHVPLVRSWTLRNARKNNPVVWVEPIVDHAAETISYEIRVGGKPPGRTVGRGGGTCLATGAPITLEYIRREGREGRIGTTQIAVVAEGPDSQVFVEPGDSTAVPHDLPRFWRPDTHLPDGGLGFRVQRYGITRHRDLFTDRQLMALGLFSEILDEVSAVVTSDALQSGLPDDGKRLADGGAGPVAYADALLTYLAFAVDRCADYWSANAIWGGGFIAHTFGRQAIPMVWDFAEGNPFSSSTGNWLGAINWISRAVDRMPASGIGAIEQRDAAARILEVGESAIATDPPYYDNIGYADLSDYFYVWLRRNLRDVWSDELSTLLTPKAEELIADPSRHGATDDANHFFESGVREVFEAAAQCQSSGAPMTVFYAFKQEETDSSGTASTGWETFLAGLKHAGFSIVRTWPIRTERPGRLRDQGSGALASSIVLVCRPRSESASLATRSEFVAALRSELPDAVRLLQRESIAPVDMAQSAIGPGMAVYSRYSKVIEADGSDMSVRQALVLINEVLQETLSAEETEFDGDTRWALTWFEQFGLNPGPFGDAETLSKAKNTSAAGVIAAGIAVQRGSEVRLLDRGELDEEWDPVDDSRLTVWEVTQYLIRSLGASESDAADLLRQVGSGVGERARQLAYLLYQVADRKGWSEEAVAYNGLVQAWPELTRLAAQSSGPVQTTLGE